MKKNWTIQNEDPKLRQKLAKSLEISEITAQILINRGIANEDEANQFLNGTLFDLPSPHLMNGMDEAVGRIKDALRENERIAIYGDYDVDGVTSTALLYTFLKDLGADVTYYNPDRITEGYGVNIEAIGKLADQGVKLVISGDCGITAVDEVEKAKEYGIDFIVTDHHKPPEVLPDAVSILNPQIGDCKYPGKEITGVGVIFNLVIGLRRSLRDEGFFKNGEPNLADYLDLVALGTVADCAPLTNVNRIFVREGTKRMLEPKRPGVRALKEVSSIEGEVSSYDLGFKLGPRVNASGRMGTAENAVRLFLSENMDDAKGIAAILNRENSQRQSVEAEILEQAVSMVESDEELKRSKSLVLSSRDWHPGIIGIVASRIVEKYERPAILIAVDEDGMGKGSGRSVSGVNIYEALNECRSMFEQFGGHELAAGISIREENISRFREMFEKSVSKSGAPGVSEIIVDCEVSLDLITEALLNELQLLSPYGIGNPEPLFLARSVEVVSKRMFKNKHLGFRVRKGDSYHQAIWFNAGDISAIPDKADIVFTPEINSWNGRRDSQLRVRDVSEAS